MSSENLKVAVRVRPFNKRERRKCCELVVSMRGGQTKLRDPDTGKTRRFAFDHSYWSHDGGAADDTGLLVKEQGHKNAEKFSGQSEVYADLGAGVLDNAWQGYNTTLFAYGQTGSGKSWSMVGYGPNQGIVPMFCESMFKQIDKRKSEQANEEKKMEYQVLFSMLEIYMEEVRDLMNPNDKGGLKIRQHPKRGFYADRLTQTAVADYNDIAERMACGTEARTVAATAMNATSSRAHTIVGITLVQRKSKSKTGGETTAMTSVINLVDLAGSERASNTGATGARLKEGSAINQSLSALGNCIAALADKAAGKRVRVPFRDSSLTKLLKNALGGNSKTIMIAAISPADINYEESLSTLRYADRAKKIKTVAKVNEDPTEKLIRELNEENKKLKEMLAQYSKNGTGIKRTLDRPEDESDSDDDEENATNITAEEKAAIKAEVEAEYKMAVQQNSREMAALKKTFSEKLKEAKSDGDSKAKKRKELSEKRKKYQHLINVNMDPQLTGQIVHFLVPPKTANSESNAGTTATGDDLTNEQSKRATSAAKSKDAIHFSVGNRKGGVKDIVLTGPKIKPSHATFSLSGGGVGAVMSLSISDPSAKVFLNGDDLEPGENREIKDNDWILFGSSQLYVFRNALKKDDTYLIPSLLFEEALEEISDIEEKRDCTISAAQLFDGAILADKEIQLLKEQWTDLSPKVQDINEISSEMNAGVIYEIYLLNSRNFGQKLGGSHLYVRGKDIRASHASHEWIWSGHEFTELSCQIEAIYSAYEEGKQMKGDPFRRNNQEYSLVGSTEVWLGSLAHASDTKAQLLHLINYNGTLSGKISIDLTPCAEDGKPSDNWVNSPSQLLGSDYHFNVCLEQAVDLPPRFSDIYAEYRVVKGKSAPKKKNEKTFRRPTVEIERSSDTTIAAVSQVEQGVQEEACEDADSKSMKSEKSGGFFEDFFSSDSDSSSEEEEEDEDVPSPSVDGAPASKETNRAIHVFTNIASAQQDSVNSGRSMSIWNHTQRFDFTNISQDILDSLKEETVFIRVWGKQEMITDGDQVVNTRKAINSKKNTSQITNLNHVSQNNTMQLHLSEKRIDKYKVKLHNIREMLVLAEEHKKPRLSIGIIDDLLNARNDKETKKILAKVKDEKVPGM